MQYIIAYIREGAIAFQTPGLSESPGSCESITYAFDEILCNDQPAVARPVL